MGEISKIVVVALSVMVLTCVCYCCSGSSVEGLQAERRANLITFLRTLAGGDEDGRAVRRLGWDKPGDPCRWGDWIWCDGAGRIFAIDISSGELGLIGTIDADSLCAAAPDLQVLSLYGNDLRGELSASIAGCKQLTYLSLSRNRLSGELPSSLIQLRGLNDLQVAHNNFSGELPRSLLGIRMLKGLKVNDNHFTGVLPDFHLPGFMEFNVSNNHFTGPIPKRIGRFGRDSFLPNAAGLCGEPLLTPCLSLSSSPSLAQPSYLSPSPPLLGVD